MLRGTPGCRRINPSRSRVSTIWWTEGEADTEVPLQSASAGGRPRLSHDLAQAVQRRFSVASSAQDHEVVGIDDKARAKALLQAELLSTISRSFCLASGAESRGRRARGGRCRHRHRAQ